MEEQSDHPLLNACILGKLFDFLDLNSLKTCRVVCHTWYLFAGTSLRKRTAVKIKCYDDIDKFNATMTHATDPSWKMLKNFSMNLLEQEISAPQVLKILKEYESSISSLKVNLLADCENADTLVDACGFAEALATLAGLEELSMYGVPFVCLGKNPFKIKCFSKLRTCILSPTTNLMLETADLEKDFTLNLLRSCGKSLKSLKLGRFSYPYLRQLFNVLTLKGLTQLVIGVDATTRVPLDVLIKLPDCCPNLERFECFIPANTTPEDVNNLLRNLMNIKCVNLLGCDARQIIPAVSAVKSLSTAYEITAGRNFASIMQIPTRFDIHEQHFPCITKLTVELHTRGAELIFNVLKNLRELIITDGSVILDKDVTGVDLENLDGQEAPHQIQRTLPYIGDLKYLQILYLGSYWITNMALKYGLADLESLSSLTIWDPRARFTCKDSKWGNQCISDESSKLDLEPLMQPQMQRLTQLTVITRRGTFSEPAQRHQLENMKGTRKHFSYAVLEKELRCESLRRL